MSFLPQLLFKLFFFSPFFSNFTSPNFTPIYYTSLFVFLFFPLFIFSLLRLTLFSFPAPLPLHFFFNFHTCLFNLLHFRSFCQKWNLFLSPTFLSSLLNSSVLNSSLSETDTTTPYYMFLLSLSPISFKFLTLSIDSSICNFIIRTPSAWICLFFFLTVFVSISVGFFFHPVSLPFLPNDPFTRFVFYLRRLSIFFHPWFVSFLFVYNL